MPQPDEASKQFGAWLRSSAKVDVQDGAAARVEVATGPDAADGGKRAPMPQRSEHDRLNEAMRDAALTGGSHRLMHRGQIRERLP